MTEDARWKKHVCRNTHGETYGRHIDEETRAKTHDIINTREYTLENTHVRRNMDEEIHGKKHVRIHMWEKT